MSIMSRKDNTKNQDDELMIVEERPAPRKVLEEDEYLGRLSKIIRKNFFSDLEFPKSNDDPSKSYELSERSDRTYNMTPGTSRTSLSTTSSLRSRHEACSMGLNEFLEKYTSEDNAYFDKLQRKELKRHRVKYPWLYGDHNKHNKSVKEQLRLPSIGEQASLGMSDNSTKMIDWPHNPKNTLFYAPSIAVTPRRPQSTINYHSSKCINEPIFKEPIVPKGSVKNKSFSRFSDKIGIDGKLLNGSETPMINGYSFIAPPESPRSVVEESRARSDTNRFFIPSESPRDELAHRVYQEKVTKSIRTPKTSASTTPALKTPSTRKGYTDFSFSPERVKNVTPNLRCSK